MPPPTVGGSSICFRVVRPSVCLSVCLLTHILCSTISLYLLEGFPWRLAQIFNMSVGIADKVFKVRCQRSRSWPARLTYIGGGLHFDLWRRSSLALQNVWRGPLGVAINSAPFNITMLTYNKGRPCWRIPFDRRRRHLANRCWTDHSIQTAGCTAFPAFLAALHTIQSCDH